MINSYITSFFLLLGLMGLSVMRGVYCKAYAVITVVGLCLVYEKMGMGAFCWVWLVSYAPLLFMTSVRQSHDPSHLSKTLFILLLSVLCCFFTTVLEPIHLQQPLAVLKALFCEQKEAVVLFFLMVWVLMLSVWEKAAFNKQKRIQSSR